MGLFSNVLKPKNNDIEFSNEEAFAGIIIAMTAADGDISDEEIDDLSVIINKSKTMASINSSDRSTILQKVFRVLRVDGLERLLELSIPALTPDLYEGTFAVICDLAYSDGYIEKEEEELLERIQQQFNIHSERALNIVEIITIKNQV